MMCRPEQPEFGREKLLGKELLDAPPVQHRFGRQHDPREAEAVAQAEAETRTMYDAAVAIEDVRPVMVRLAGVEGEEFLRDGNRGIACGGDRLEQIERAAEFLVKDGARQVVAALRAAAEKEPAAQPLVRLVDRDVRPGHPRVPDEKGGRRQSAKSATDDMRPHRPSPFTPRRRRGSGSEQNGEKDVKGHSRPAGTGSRPCDVRCAPIVTEMVSR